MLPEEYFEIVEGIVEKSYLKWDDHRSRYMFSVKFFDCGIKLVLKEYRDRTYMKEWTELEIDPGERVKLYIYKPELRRAFQEEYNSILCNEWKEPNEPSLDHRMFKMLNDGFTVDEFCEQMSLIGRIKGYPICYDIPIYAIEVFGEDGRVRDASGTSELSRWDKDRQVVMVSDPEVTEKAIKRAAIRAAIMKIKDDMEEETPGAGRRIVWLDF